MLASVESIVVGRGTNSLPGVDPKASVWVGRPLLLVMGAAGGGCFRSNMPETLVTLFLYLRFSNVFTVLVACVRLNKPSESPYPLIEAWVSARVSRLEHAPSRFV
jgi:hypothetical protein